LFKVPFFFADLTNLPPNFSLFYTTNPNTCSIQLSRGPSRVLPMPTLRFWQFCPSYRPPDAYFTALRSRGNLCPLPVSALFWPWNVFASSPVPPLCLFLRARRSSCGSEMSRPYSCFRISQFLLPRSNGFSHSPFSSRRHCLTYTCMLLVYPCLRQQARETVGPHSNTVS